jgi:hypothetical protein
VLVKDGSGVNRPNYHSWRRMRETRVRGPV